MELVPPQIRATSTALSYNVANAVFGGTAPFLGAMLTVRFGHLAPGFYITVVAAIALVIVIGIISAAQFYLLRDSDDKRGADRRVRR